MQSVPCVSSPSTDAQYGGTQSSIGCIPATSSPNTPQAAGQTYQWQGGATPGTQNQQNQNQQPYRTLLQSVPAPVAPLPPTEFQRVVFNSAGQTPPIFGANLFKTPPSTFAPVDNIPVTPDYVIGPGDELRIQIWGQVNQQGSFVVDRTGSIALPQVGTVHVAGVQFSQLSDFLKSQLGRIYRNFDLNVNLGQLRSIQVLVVGQARQPGSFSIGSLSTLLNALFASGGPLPQGSLRDIQVKRGSETITHFDLYDLLLHGDKTKDVRLESGDVIFIPDVGPQVAVMGSVTTPSIYELRGEKSFNQVIALAGGLTNAASDSRLRVDRIYKHSERSVSDVDLASGDSTPVQDGDIIDISSIIDRFKDAVTLRGNVANPGRYMWHQGMRISDLIPNRDALITRSYYQGLNQLGQAKSEYDGPLPNTNANDPCRTQPPAGGQPIRTIAALGRKARWACNRGRLAMPRRRELEVGTSGSGSSVGATLTTNSSRLKQRRTWS